MNILNSINSSADIKKLDKEQLEPLCAEIRQFLIENVSRTGGHLASNLGAVELTVALHRVYNTPKDRIVFDVGHQCYTHKIITGRRDRFNTLRQYGGISGFPKPYESGDDAFTAGHASESISVALGMAKARTQLGQHYDVAAVIGDGALTGGLAFEGLENAASSNEPIVIVLNDNNMSINANVGATVTLLEGLRVRPGYIHFKRWYRETVGKIKPLYDVLHKIKEWLKSWLIPANFFSEMGLYYLGPVDGHNVNELETVLHWAREMKQPVIVHVVTRKGKGCSYAEENPELYHGVGVFDPETGETGADKESFSSVFGKCMIKLADTDPKLSVLTAAMASGTGLDIYAKRYPDRFSDVGITEGNAVAMASGMAKQGLHPVFAVYSSFLQRGYDMLIQDTALQKLHVVYAVDRAGLVGNDGETHHGLFDVDYLCSVPGMTVYSPSSFAELCDMLCTALYSTQGPVAVRYPRGGEEEYKDSHPEPESVLRSGSDITLLGYGILINEILKAAELLEQSGISAEVVKIGRLNPADFSVTLSSIKKTGRLIAAEEVCASGCIGQRVLARCAQDGVCLKGARLLNIGEGIAAHGANSRLLRDFGLDAGSIAASAKALVENNGDK